MPLFVFDAFGTLLDVHSAVARHAGAVGDQAERLSELWRTKQLEYSWVRSLSGRYRDFQEITANALAYAGAKFGLPSSLRAPLMQAYATLDAYPDAAPALARLKQSGAQTAILSNGTPAMLKGAAAVSGLSQHLDALLSVDPLQVYKTDPRAYALVLDHFGCPLSDVTFVSSNRWDIAGAKAFGFRPIWLNRTNQPDEYDDLPPDRVIDTLDAL